VGWGEAEWWVTPWETGNHDVLLKGVSLMTCKPHNQLNGFVVVAGFPKSTPCFQSMTCTPMLRVERPMSSWADWRGSFSCCLTA
jgi:hypothetical protein